MRFGKTLRRTGRVFACLALLLWAPACARQDKVGREAIVVAVIAPFSGDFEPWGAAVRNGVILAADGWNQQGGVLGRPVQVLLKDGRCDYNVARQVTTEAIKEGAQFIIGEVCSVASEGVAQVTTDMKVLQIAPTSVDPETTLKNDGNVRPLVFRIPFLDVDQGIVAAHLALETLRADTAAILYAENSEYGLTLADAFEKTFTDGDGEILVRKTYNQDAEEYFDVLSEVRDANPDILYLPGYFNVMNRLVAQARRFGMFQTIIGSDGWDSPDLDFAVTDGSYFTTHYFSGEPRPEVKAWTQLYTARHQVEPDAVATLSYDAVNILFAAVTAAGTLEPFAVADVLETATFEAVSGQLTFDKYHNPTKGVLVVRVFNGRVIYVDRLMP
ncbi:MAG: ABC transporter substrate-binding protein [Anaerolineae bacterium]